MLLRNLLCCTEIGLGLWPAFMAVWREQKHGDMFSTGCSGLTFPALHRELEWFFLLLPDFIVGLKKIISGSLSPERPFGWGVRWVLISLRSFPWVCKCQSFPTKEPFESQQCGLGTRICSLPYDLTDGLSPPHQTLPWRSSLRQAQGKVFGFASRAWRYNPVLAFSFAVSLKAALVQEQRSR